MGPLRVFRSSSASFPGRCIGFEPDPACPQPIAKIRGLKRGHDKKRKAHRNPKSAHHRDAERLKDSTSLTQAYCATGRIARIVESDVIRIGRNRLRPASAAAC